MNREKHLPIYGVGPIYGIVVIALTVAGVALSTCGSLSSGHYDGHYIPVNILAILVIAFGIMLWAKAMLQSKIDDSIVNNRLVTTGVYAWVRNPIYSAFMFACTGTLLFTHNVWLLLLPLVYWAFLTILMKHTEEKWLLEKFGAEYKAYCRRTNLCIPWFSKKEKKQ